MGSYRERLLVPVSYWLLAVPVVVLLGAEACFIVGGIVPPLVIGAARGHRRRPSWSTGARRRSR